MIACRQLREAMDLGPVSVRFLRTNIIGLAPADDAFPHRSNSNRPTPIFSGPRHGFRVMNQIAASYISRRSGCAAPEVEDDRRK
jgi:hypothetical protein